LHNELETASTCGIAEYLHMHAAYQCGSYAHLR
jgi:hypothetical protein